MKITPRHLVRLFPRTWRARYGTEFEAMLEASELTAADVRGIVRHAAGEWVATTMTGRIVLGALLSTLATIVALELANLAPGGVFAGRQVWTLELSLLAGLLATAIGCRFFWCVVTGFKAGSREQTLWLLAMFVASTLAQWGQMVGWHDSVPPGVPVLWTYSILFMATTCMNMLSVSQARPSGMPPTRLRRRPSAHPLGLA